MTQAARNLTFEEYVNLDAEAWAQLGLPEGRCEYADGELTQVPSESRINLLIANILFLAFIQAGIPLNLVYTHACEVEVPGKPRTRYPDLVVLRAEHLQLTERRAIITLDMPPPRLAVEVVSPGDQNHRRDYVAKRQQYQERGIPEYWLINPQDRTVTILELAAGQYGEASQFRDGDLIQSSVCPGLNLSINQLFETIDIQPT
ncbi:MAG: Uma2 family endonuclease [Elainella sp.]